MNYESIRNSAIPHRGVLATSLLLMLALTRSAGLLFADTLDQPAAAPYSLRIQVTADATHHRKTLRLDVIEASTGAVITSPLVTIADGSSATISSGEMPGRPAFATTVDDGRRTATLVVTAAGTEIERRAFSYPAK